MVAFTCVLAHADGTSDALREDAAYTVGMPAHNAMATANVILKKGVV